MATKQSETSTRKGVQECAELLRELIAAFVFNPDEIDIEIHDSGAGVAILEISVTQADYGVVNGKTGRQIQGLQTLFRFIGLRSRIELRLLLKECERSDKRDLPAPFMPDADWTPDKVVALLTKLLSKMLLNPFSVNVIQTTSQATLEILADKEEQKIITAYKPYLHVLFHAVGRAAGFNVFIADATPLPAT